MHLFQFLASIAITLVSLQSQSQQATREVPVVDPILQMTAWSISIPSTWTLEGTMLPNSSCNAATSPTFHAKSADGKTGVYLLPRIDWAWGASTRAGSDCLPLNSPLSAKAFLSNLLEARGLRPLAEEPMPELADMRRNTDAMNQQMQGMQHNTVDAARVLATYTLEGTETQEALTAIVQCFEARVPAVGLRSGCSAFVTRWYAPKDRFEATRPAFKSIRETLNQAWMQSWTQAMRSQNAALTAGQTAALLQQGRVAQQARTNQQKSFMQGFNHQADVRNDAFAQQQQNKQVQSDNFVDYVLDCSRLYSGNTRVSVGSNCPNRQTF